MFSPGTLLGERYRVSRLLGTGGMAAVYEAEHTAIQRRVAVKIMHSAFADNPELVARFKHEALTASQLAHAHIVEVIDVGTHKTLPFMVMELLLGEGLASRIESQRMMDVPTACHIIDQILEALEYVHSHEVVHRDLKPENVQLVTRGEVEDFVKLLDFGVSRARFATRQHARTRSGVVLGTPHYMSPEQALGSRDVDHRTDLYAVGVMLFELITGQLPIDAPNTTELLMKIVDRRREVPLMSTLVEGVPAGLDEVVACAMDPLPLHRFLTAGAMREALAEWVPPRNHRTDRAPSSPPQRTPDEFFEPYDASAVRVVAPRPWPTDPPKESSEPEALPTPAAPVHPTETFVLSKVSTKTSASLSEAPARGPHSSTASVPPTERPSADRPSSVIAGAPWRGLSVALVLGIALGAAITSVRSRAPVTAVQVAEPAPVAPVEAQVAVSLEGLPSHARVVVDGVEVLARGITLARDTRHRVHVDAEGYAPFDGELPGGAAVWAFSLGAVPLPSPPAPSAPVAATPTVTPSPEPSSTPDGADRHHHRRRHPAD